MTDFTDLVKLNDISIYEHLKYTGQESLVVMFYMDRCKPCDKAKPRFVATMHRDSAEETTKALDITLYPSFALFRDGRCVSVRQGSHNKLDLERWLVYA